MQRVWKGLLAGMLACLLLAGSCWAAPELAGLSDGELDAIVKAAQAELERRAENPILYMTNEELSALLAEAALIQQQRTEAAYQQYLADLETRYAGSDIHKLSEMEDVFLGVEHIETGARICLGMPLAELKALLGEPDDASDISFVYSDLGLQVFVDGSSNIRRMTIFRPLNDPPQIRLFNGVSTSDSINALIYSFDHVLTADHLSKDQFILLHKTEEGRYITLDSVSDATTSDAILVWAWHPIASRAKLRAGYMELYYWDDYAQAVYTPEVTDSAP